MSASIDTRIMRSVLMFMGTLYCRASFRKPTQRFAVVRSYQGEWRLLIAYRSCQNTASSFLANTSTSMGGSGSIRASAACTIIPRLPGSARRGRAAR